MTEQEQALAFIQRWQGVTASELATSQSFAIALCELLGVERPHPGPEQRYEFERPITFRHGDGSSSPGRIDLYRAGCFVWESKKLRAGQSTRVFDEALLRARSQAESYARALPAAEGRPPFLVVVDVGSCIELYADFTRSGATYIPFPDPRSHRIALTQLADAATRQRLRLLWTDPLALDPARASGRVTRAVAAELAGLARSLEADGHAPQTVAAFLTRCLFSLFAEDVGLLPAGADGLGAFEGLLRQHRARPDTLARMLQVFWDGLDHGGFNPAIAESVLRFNGKLFKGSAADGYALPLKPEQTDGLLRAARADWREVEPAIFGTLLERALDPAERHQLGAHYTPRAYVERLVLPTVVEPLRQDWADARAAALLLAREAEALDDTRKRETKLDEARAELQRFHHQLCSVRVLDPACGSGNFLYITLEHLKRLEGEVLDQLAQLGQRQDKLDLAGETVTLQQLRGIELNPRAAALAELVLWIGYLQWQLRTKGPSSVAEPVVHDYGNIECRDAVLAWDGKELATDADGRPLLRWDGKTRKPHPVTGEPVPDETALVEQWRYLNPRPAEWPQADFIVGNPPFIGTKRMRSLLGDGYVDALRSEWRQVPDSADFVMYWWDRAAELLAAKKIRSFGLITTNSLRQTFNRAVLDRHLLGNTPIKICFAIPDHPWVESSDGAAVRIAMTTACRHGNSGRLVEVAGESEGTEGEVLVSMRTSIGPITADLRVGASTTTTAALKSNAGLSGMGVALHGAGFILLPEEAQSLRQQGAGSIRSYLGGKDLLQRPRERYLVDFFGLELDEARRANPGAFQRVMDRVKPERDHNSRKTIRELWWRFGWERPVLRAATRRLSRYIGTTETAKHRVFQWIDAGVLADHMVVCIAVDEGSVLGVLSSHVHISWALAAGGTLEDRPRYNKSVCFETFPFPSEDTGLSPALTTRIRDLAEQLDAHRKARQAAHESVTLTGLYNVLAKLRRAEPLGAKDKLLHEQGLVGVLHSLHEELDAAVLAAYGWSDLGPVPWTDDEAHRAWTEALLQRLVALNAKRAAEEANGLVRWLRPEFQDPQRRSAATPAATTAQQPPLPDTEDTEEDLADGSSTATAAARGPARQPWPAALPEQMRAVAELLAAQRGAPLTEAALAERFSGRGPWKKRLPSLLATLEALGRAQATPEGWRAAT
jgi:hypothetical protein